MYTSASDKRLFRMTDTKQDQKCRVLSNGHTWKSKLCLIVLFYMNIPTIDCHSVSISDVPRTFLSTNARRRYSHY